MIPSVSGGCDNDRYTYKLLVILKSALKADDLRKHLYVVGQPVR